MTQTWFKVTEVADSTWRIEDGFVSCYLAAGKEKALLIDTAWGIWDLKSLVSSLTSLPLIVVNTHGHPDHVSGNYMFSDVHIHERDMDIMRHSTAMESRARAVKRFIGGPLPDGFDEHAWVSIAANAVTAFCGGLTFDLGGRQIDTIEVPGHSPGSVCLLDKSQGLLFTGDSVSAGDILLLFDTCLPMSVFLDSLENLSRVAGAHSFLPSHGKSPISPATLDDLRAGLSKILAGEIRGVEYQSQFGPGLLCRFGSCGVLYREDRLRPDKHR